LFNSLFLAQDLLLQKLQESDDWSLENKKYLQQLYQQYLELNRKSVSYYSAKEKDYDGHCQLNQQLNQSLKKVKKLQLKLHRQRNCCPNCRFC
jgi:DNA repair exonuclease SbcCD ATPase subunit